MRYQLPDGMSSISAAGHAFEADIDGIITVAADIGHEVHAGLQDIRLWGLTPIIDVDGAVVTTPATETDHLTAPPTEAPGPMRDHKRNLVTLLRGFGHNLDGRATFEFLRKRAIAALQEMGLEATPPAPVPAPAAPAALPAAPVDLAQAASPPDATPAADGPVDGPVEGAAPAATEPAAEKA